MTTVQHNLKMATEKPRYFRNYLVASSKENLQVSIFFALVAANLRISF
uniref:Uncharacterized protein n=1 Tax=viral metagenome TaxID=1070528 RepID=A0A6C0F646_9ZZZZ